MLARPPQGERGIAAALGEAAFGDHHLGEPAIVERGELAPFLRLQPGGRLDDRADGAGIGLEQPVRVGPDRAAHRVRIIAADPFRDLHAGGRQVPRLLDPVLPQVDHGMLVEDRDLAGMAEAADRGHRLLETDMGFLESAHVAERERLAGERISEPDRRVPAGTVAALHGDGLVEQDEGAGIVAGGRLRLPQRRQDLDRQRIVVGGPRGLERALAMRDRAHRLAEPVMDVAEPEMGPGERGRIPRKPGPLDRALEDRELLARRIEHAGAAEPLGDPIPAQRGLRARRHPVQRIERHPILGLGAVDRGGFEGLVPGQLGIVRGLGPAFAMREMVGEGLDRLLLAAFGDPVAERAGDVEVHGDALAQADAVVDDLAGQPVLELQRPFALAGEDEVRLGEPGHQRVGDVAGTDHLEQPDRDDVADDRGSPHQIGLGRRQARQARLDQRADPGSAFDQLDVGLPRRDRMAQFLDEERLAAGGIADAADQERVGRGQQPAHHLRGFRLGEAGQPQHLPVADLDVAGLVRAAGHQDEQRADAGERGQRRARGVVGQVPIVDEQDRGLPPRERFEQGVDGRGRVLALDRGLATAGRRLAVEREQPQPDPPVRGQGPVDPREPLRDPPGGLVPLQGRADAEDGARDLQEGLQRLGPGVALAAMHRAAALRRVAQEFLGEAGLALAGRSPDLEQQAVAGDDAVEAPAEVAQLRFAADERGQPGALARRIARADRRASQDHERRHGLVLAAQRQLADRLGLEQIALGPERRLADQYLVGAGAAAQARGDVGRPAEQLEPAAHRVSDREQDPPGMDAAVQPRRDIAPPWFPAERAHRFPQVQRRIDRSCRIVLARLGMAEGGQHAVAADLGDDAAMLGDHPVVDGPQALEHVAIVLGLEAAGDARRLGEVGKEDRHRPAARPFGRCRVDLRRFSHPAPPFNCHEAHARARSSARIICLTVAGDKQNNGIGPGDYLAVGPTLLIG